MYNTQLLMTIILFDAKIDLLVLTSQSINLFKIILSWSLLEIASMMWNGEKH